MKHLAIKTMWLRGIAHPPTTRQAEHSKNAPQKSVVICLLKKEVNLFSHIFLFK
jgi:hypothetical protein